MTNPEPLPTTCTSYFDPHAPLQRSQRNLPHWYQQGAAYFVTFRLADSVPEKKLKQWRAEREQWEEANPLPLTQAQKDEYAERFPARFQAWLDAGHGACVLNQPTYGKIVGEAIRFFDGQRYHLDAWVVMSNHVHVIFQAIEPHTPKQILHSWKSYTANAINQHLGRTGSLWQKESYDHIIRSPAELHHYRQYIAENPAKAHITATDASFH